MFIVGCPRSGTSWTWGIMVCLPVFEPLLIEDFEGIETRAGVNKMKLDAGYRTTETTVFFSNLSDEQIKAAVRAKQNKFLDKLLLEKTPSNILKIDRILKVFPNARFIHLIRDPRANVSSLVNTRFKTGFKFAKDLEEGIKQYRNHFICAKPYLDQPNFYNLRYEDLHQKPHGTVRGLLEFLGVSEQVPDAAVDEAIGKNHQRVLSVQENLFRKGQPASYEQELSNSQLAKIESKLKDIFKIYGYERKYSRLSYRLFGWVNG